MADNDFNRQDRSYDTGTHIHVEKKRKANWLWLLVPLILGLLVLPMFNRHDDNRVGSTVERNPQVAAVTYQGQTWQPRGAAQNLNANQVQAIGTSNEGYQLFRSTTTGGGGGMGAKSGDHQIYMKNSNGMFQPLARVGETNDGNHVENDD